MNIIPKLILTSKSLKVISKSVKKESHLKFIYSEKVTKFCKIFTLLCPTYVVPVKIKVNMLQNFVAFSENMNFMQYIRYKEQKMQNLAFLLKSVRACT